MTPKSSLKPIPIASDAGSDSSDSTSTRRKFLKYGAGATAATVVGLSTQRAAADPPASPSVSWRLQVVAPTDPTDEVTTDRKTHETAQWQEGSSFYKAVLEVDFKYAPARPSSKFQEVDPDIDANAEVKVYKLVNGAWNYNSTLIGMNEFQLVGHFEIANVYIKEGELFKPSAANPSGLTGGTNGSGITAVNKNVIGKFSDTKDIKMEVNAAIPADGTRPATTLTVFATMTVKVVPAVDTPPPPPPPEP